MLTRSSGLYLCDWKIRKNPNPFPILENLVRIILVWCGRWDWILAARRRSVSAVLKPHRGLIHCGFFKSVSRVYKKEAQRFLPSLFLWCGKQDWILAARRRSVSAVLKPHRGLIHCGFFKSVSRVYKKRSPAILPSFFLWCGKQDLNLHEIAFTRT